MSAYPSSDELHARLKAAGWTVGYAGTVGPGGPLWQVSGHKGENQIRASGRTLAEAYWRACLQAEAAGTLRRADGAPGHYRGRG
jgi:hypothetical protein